MLNKIFRTIILGFFSLVLVTTFTSCKKEKDIVAIITVKDSSGNLVSGATVTLYPAPVHSQTSGDLPNSSLTKSNVTDANGKVQFTYELEAILNVEATKTILPNTYTGKNIIRLLKGKTVEKTIEIN